MIENISFLLKKYTQSNDPWFLKKVGIT